MIDNEINMFINAMSDLGDEWTFEDAKRVYGDYLLDTAIDERSKEVHMHLQNIASLIK